MCLSTFNPELITKIHRESRDHIVFVYKAIAFEVRRKLDGWEPRLEVWASDGITKVVWHDTREISDEDKAGWNALNELIRDRADEDREDLYKRLHRTLA